MRSIFLFPSSAFSLFLSFPFSRRSSVSMYLSRLAPDLSSTRSDSRAGLVDLLPARTTLFFRLRRFGAAQSFVICSFRATFAPLVALRSLTREEKIQLRRRRKRSERSSGSQKTESAASSVPIETGRVEELFTILVSSVISAVLTSSPSSSDTSQGPPLVLFFGT